MILASYYYYCIYIYIVRFLGFLYFYPISLKRVTRVTKGSLEFEQEACQKIGVWRICGGVVGQVLEVGAL